MNGEKINVQSSDIGLAAYQKKSEYNFSTVNVNSKLVGDKQSLMIENDSNVYINEKRIKPNIQKVYSKLYANDI